MSEAIDSLLNIPVFPPWCVVLNAETECTLLNVSLPCLPAVTEGKTPFSLGIEEAHFWTFLVLLTVGLIFLGYVPRPWEADNSMKIITGLYAIETAFFPLFRYYWGLGRPLIASAAVHNLFEWAIVIHVAAGTTMENVRPSIVIAIFWINIVVAITLMVPYLLLAFLTEEATGILLDFSMPIMFIYKYMQGGQSSADSADVRRFYLLPGIAHTLHILFTILPLVFATFHVGNVTWYSSFYLETVLYISAPMTHILYGVWAWQYDRIRAEYRKTNPGDRGLLPEKYRIEKVKMFLIIGFVMGLLTLVGLPLAMGICSEPTTLPEKRSFSFQKMKSK